MPIRRLFLFRPFLSYGGLSCGGLSLGVLPFLALPLLLLVGLSSAVAGSDGTPASAARETREALDMARAELQRDLSNEALSDDEATDFRAYLLSLEQQLEQQCDLLPEHRRPTEVCELAPKNTVSVDTAHEQTVGERGESLDQELEASLSAFDQMLLEEQETLSAQTARAASDGGDNGGDNGGDSDGNQAGKGKGKGKGEGNGKGRKSRRGRDQQDDTNNASDAEQNAEGQGSHKGREQSQANAHTDPNRPARWEDVATPPDKSSQSAADRSREPTDGQDDDVVARQIREAAEKEADPKLREKLWEEYRRYKRGL